MAPVQINVTFTIDGILNVSAVENGEAKKYKSESKVRVEAKNALDNYAYNLRNSLNAEKLKEKTPEADKKAVDDKVPETLQRLDVNQAAEKEEFESGPPGSAEDVCICWRMNGCNFFLLCRQSLFCWTAVRKPHVHFAPRPPVSHTNPSYSRVFLGSPEQLLGAHLPGHTTQFWVYFNIFLSLRLLRHPLLDLSCLVGARHRVV
ncbi:hypothetical protein PI124_g9442 [Phytophthora idaei]|nr:hypothetical protein PI124_g9442 [Phytophthora idaei]